MADIRQTILKDVVNQLADNQANVEVDDLLRSVDNEVTPPLRMKIVSPATHVVTIDPLVVVNPETNRNRTIPPIAGVALPLSFASATVTLPSGGGSGTGNVTESTVANTVALSMSANQFQRIGLFMNQVGQIQLTVGIAAGTAAAATIPTNINGAFAIGHILAATDGSNEVNAVVNTSLFQYGGGGGGGGSGDANILNTALRDELANVGYGLVTPNIIAVDEEDLIDGGPSTGTFNSADGTYDLEAAEIMQTIQLLDASEFLGSGEDVSCVSLTVFWALAAIDTAATYKISRDGGQNFTDITMNRVGTTGTFYGDLETFVEGSFANIAQQATETADEELNATSAQLLSQSFTAASSSVLTEVDLYATLVGSPSGLVFVSIRADAAGDPGAVLSESDAVDITTITGGVNTFTIPNTVIDASTTYHIVIRTDAAYKLAYSSGVTELNLRKTTTGSGLQTNDGATWTPSGTDSLRYTVRGRVLDVQVQITASATSKLAGFGLFYKPETTSVTGIIDTFETTFSTADNTNQFTLPFCPDPNLIRVYYVQTGGVYVTPAFQVSGKTIIFPVDTFDGGGETYDVTLRFQNIEGSSFDNSEQNATTNATQDIQLDALGIKTKCSDQVDVAEISVPFTNINGRKPIKDLAAIPSPRMGIERIGNLQGVLLDGESGPLGEPVYAMPGETYDRIRYVGATWTFFEASARTGASAGTFYAGSTAFGTTTTDYMEISFYGTDINLLSRGSTNNIDVRATVDGGAEIATNIIGISSTVLDGRNYSSNVIFPANLNLAPGHHTVRFRIAAAFNTLFMGVEIINDSATLDIPAGNIISKDQNLGIPATSTTYNSGFDVASDPVGTRGGHVVVYGERASDGSISVKKRFNAAGSQLNFTAADHSNEEVLRKINWREFGANLPDDFSTLGGSTSDRAFTLDDGTTALVGNDVRSTTVKYVFNAANGAFLTLTFVGTGLAITDRDSGSVALDPHEVFVDGVSIGSITALTDVNLKPRSIVSGLPFGTHTVKIQRNAFADSTLLFEDFIIYGPKKPTIPEGAAELGSYYLVADFVANTTAGLLTISQGVIRKSITREMVAIDTWTLTPADPPSYVSGFGVFSNVNTARISYTFFGSGLDIRGSTDTNHSANIQLDLDGATDFSSYTTNAYGDDSSFTAVTGIYDKKVTTQAFGSGLTLEGFSLGLHTIGMELGDIDRLHTETFDIITPIYAYSSNSLLLDDHIVGSNSLKSEVGLANYVKGKKHFPDGVDLGASNDLWQKKTLTAAINADSTDINDLRFNNLTIGQTYQLFTHFEMFLSAGNDWQVRIYNGSLQILKSRTDGDGGSEGYTISGSVIFVASDTVVSVDTTGMTGSSSLQSDAGNTFMILVEKNTLSPTTKF